MSENVTGDRDALAAEYVLGTLPLDERNAAATLRAQDSEFAAKVKVWERRLGELHLMVEPVEPDPDIWLRIRAKLPELAPAEPLNPAPAGPLGPAPAESISAVAVAPAVDNEPKPEPHQISPAPLAATETETETEPVVSSFAKRQTAGSESNDPKSDDPKSDDPKSDDPKSAEPRSAEPEAAEPKPQTEPSITTAPDIPGAADVPPPTPDVAAASFFEVTLEEAPADTASPRGFDVSAAGASAVADALAAPGNQAAPAAMPLSASTVPAEKLRLTRQRLALWRAAALLMALSLLAVSTLVALWRYLPERVPHELRPVALMRLVGIRPDTSAAQRKPAPPESRFDE